MHRQCRLSNDGVGRPDAIARKNLHLSVLGTDDISNCLQDARGIGERYHPPSNVADLLHLRGLVLLPTYLH